MRAAGRIICDRFFAVGALSDFLWRSFREEVVDLLDGDKEDESDDQEINGGEMQLENQALKLIALQQPVASDFRTIVSVLKASSDLERIGDHAVSIAKETILVKGNQRVPQIEEKISAMTADIRKMLEQVLDAYVKADEKSARNIAQEDKKLDEQYKVCRNLIVKEMQHETKTAVATSSYLLVARLLERIGDHIVNLSEWIVYSKNGHLVELNDKQ
ncbi:MAG: phosphate signaling complex protein PhoU [Lactobacillus ruminis]|nr:phosphate signaling complex protein PhoU [Ligilactobacillus ruminis]